MKRRAKKQIVRPLVSGGQTLGYAIWCEGCNESHVFYTVPGHASATWKFDGDMQAPTFTPSLLIKSGHYVDGKHPCWCDYNREHPKKRGPSCGICHTIVTQGRIQFMGDCTHKLAGQTRPLIPF